MTRAICDEVAEKTDVDLDGHSAFINALLSHFLAFHLSQAKRRNDHAQINDVAEINNVAEKDLDKFLRKDQSALAQNFRFKVSADH